VLRFHTDPFHNKVALTTTNSSYHGNSKKDRFTPILSDIIRMMSNEQDWEHKRK
jgi:hypothetical protein